MIEISRKVLQSLRSSAPSAFGGVPGMGYWHETSSRTRDRQKSLLGLPGKVWRTVYVKNRFYVIQIVILIVIIVFLTTAFVFLNSFGTLLAWQQSISARISETFDSVEVQPYDILDLHQVQQYEGLDSEDVIVGVAPDVVNFGALRPQKLRIRQQSYESDFSALTEAWFLDQLNATIKCKFESTSDVYVFGLDKPSAEGSIRLAADEDHELFLISYDNRAVRRCSGGDYFEIDLEGPHWKSRPPVKDMGDGGYAVKLRVDRRFAGTYSFKVILLFGGFSGLYQQPQKFAKYKIVINVTMEFFVPSSFAIASDEQRPEVDDISLCSSEADLHTYPWQGRWTRNKANESCKANSEGRWRCLDPEEPCEKPWCDGPVGSLESNGWAYSAHCHFRIFTQEEAWSCLSGKHLFFWGDSNHPDTSRNLINFLLGLNSGNLPRIYDREFSSPLNSKDTVRLTVVFNGHVVMKFNNMGLKTLGNETYRETLLERLSFESRNNTFPDAFILNSGIHDGVWWRTLDEYIKAAKQAADFWVSVWRNTSDDKSKRPKVVYRTTIAPAGTSRSMPANPQKMEVLNAIMVENMVKAFGRENLRIVDEFDMTFPFHYDNEHSDGGHYGRIPSANSWWPGGHKYFVDVMLAHILLNSICPL